MLRSPESRLAALSMQDEAYLLHLRGQYDPEATLAMKNLAVTLNRMDRTEQALALWNEALSYEQN